MNPRVKKVSPNPDYTISLTFENGENRIFDVKPYLEKGIFQDLKDFKIFNSVKPVLGSVQWQPRGPRLHRTRRAQHTQPCKLRLHR